VENSSLALSVISDADFQLNARLGDPAETPVLGFRIGYVLVTSATNPASDFLLQPVIKFWLHSYHRI
jgi:hypothetical protein